MVENTKWKILNQVKYKKLRNKWIENLHPNPEIRCIILNKVSEIL
jgi:hypothetical protein